MALDKTDKSIIKLLRQDPRMSYSKIADTIGISRVTVKSHMERMLNKNLVEINIKENLIKQAVKMAILGLEVKSEEHWDECIEKLSNLPWVLKGFRSIGKANLRVLILGESDDILEQNIDEFRYYHCVNFVDAEILGKTIIDNQE